MRRPTVLHCAQEWPRAGDPFADELVRTSSATRSSVVARDVAPGLPWSPADVHALADRLARLPGRLQSAGLPAYVAACAVHERARLLHQHGLAWTSVVGGIARAGAVRWVLSLERSDLVAHEAAGSSPPPLLAHADAIIVSSEEDLERAVRIGVPPARLHVVPTGVDLAGLPFRERRAEPGRPPHVVLVGVAPDRRAALIEELGSAVRASFLSLDGEGDGAAGSPVDPDAMARAFAEADLVVTAAAARSTRSEVLEIAEITALGMGPLLVAGARRGRPRALASVSTVVDSGDDRALAAAVHAVLDAPETWSDRGQQGRAGVAARHELGARVADVEEVYAAALDRRPPSLATRPAGVRRPAVSVIVATRDRRALVNRALDALSAQTYPPHLIEVAVIDNGSTDGTDRDLLDRARSDERLRLVAPAPDLNVAAARNRAAAASSGEILLFTDDDCRPTPTWIEALVAGMEDGVGVVQGRTVPDPDLRVLPLSRTQYTELEYGLYETCNIAYRRSVFELAGGFDETFAREVASHLGRRFARYPFGEDTDLAWRVRRAGATTRFSATAVVHHHVFPPSRRLLLRRAWVSAAWPLLVRRAPELGRGFLIGGVFLQRRRALAMTGAAGAAGAALSRAAGRRGTAVLLAALAAPYVTHLTRPLQPGAAARWRALPVWTAVDACQTVALLYGSARARRLVL